MIVELIGAILGSYYVVGLLVMTWLVGMAAHNPYVHRLLGDPSPSKYVEVTLVMAWVWPYFLAEMISNNDRSKW